MPGSGAAPPNPGDGNESDVSVRSFTDSEEEHQKLEIFIFRFTMDWEDSIHVISDGNHSPDIVHSCSFLALVRRSLKILKHPC